MRTGSFLRLEPVNSETRSTKHETNSKLSFGLPTLRAGPKFRIFQFPKQYHTIEAFNVLVIWISAIRISDFVFMLLFYATDY